LPVLPRFAEDAGASPTTAGFLVASFSVAQLLFAPVWGRVSDRIGRKPVLIVSLVGTAVGSLLTGLAGSALWLLFLGRAVDGASRTGWGPRRARAAAAHHRVVRRSRRVLGLRGDVLVADASPLRPVGVSDLRRVLRDRRRHRRRAGRAHPHGGDAPWGGAHHT